MTSPSDPRSATIDTSYWKRIDALLSVVLALPPEERPRWLETLDPEHAEHKPLLAEMLARAEAETRTFMEMPVAAATLEAAADRLHGDQPGDVVGPYRLLQQLGAGGMGTVWSAEREDGTLQRRVALKLPRAGWSPGLAERLARECDILSTLEHPGIARLYDAGLADNDRPYLAMEAIDGQPIDQYCRSHGSSIPARLRLFLQVAKAIAYAHARLVVHRDLKPSNILVDSAGAVHVVDFGLAAVIDPGGNRQARRLTQTTGRILTPDYASPEQIRGEAIAVGTDVYSLGVVLYELLSAHRPYRLKRESAAALEEAIVEADVPLASSQVTERALARALRGDLDTILAKALRKEVPDRYPTVEAFAADIDRHLSGRPVLARPESFLYTAGKFIRRQRATVAAGLLVAIAVVAGLAGTSYQARIAEGQARQASVERDKALRELRFAESSENFMRFLLSEQSVKPLAPQELLRRAERAIELQYADDAQLRSRMQLLIADLYGEVNDFKRAEVVLGEARRAAESSGDRDAQVQIDCTLAALFVAVGKNAEAMALFDTVMPELESRPGAEARTAQICYTQRSVALRNLGQPEASARDAEAALRSMGPEQPGQQVDRILLRTTIADTLSYTGRLPEAVAIYERATDDFARIGRGNTSAGMLITNNLVVLLGRAGQPRRALEAYARVAEREQRGDGSSRQLAINYARVLVGVGRAREAEPLLRDAAREAARLGDSVGEAYALLSGAAAALSLGDVARCEALLDGTEKKARAIFPPHHSFFATVELLRAKIAMMRGNAARAATLAQSAVERYEAAADRSHIVIRAVSLLALARQRTGDPSGAAAAAARAVDMARDAAKGFDRSEWLGSALLAQAEIHKDQGDPASARALLADAREHLVKSVGSDTPAVRDLDALARSLGR